MGILREQDASTCHVCGKHGIGEAIFTPGRSSSAAGGLGRRAAEAPATALSRKLNLAGRRVERPVWAQAVVAARHVRNASVRRMRSVRRDVRWRWTLKVLWTAA